MIGGLALGRSVQGGLSRLFRAPARLERGDGMHTATKGYDAPKFGDVLIGISCRGGLGGDKDEQA
jgi:hypothetical protein